MTDHTPEFLAQYRPRYGLGFSQTSPDYSRCAEEVCLGGRWTRYAQCTRPNGHGPHGAWCKQHDPVARKAKQEARHAKMRAGWAEQKRDSDFTAAARDAVRQIAAGHNDPRGLCEAILRKLEGGAE